MKYNTLHPLSKLLKMWEKVNAFKRFCDGERNFFSNKGGLWGFLCTNILLANLLESQHFLEVLQTLLTFKNSEKVVKSYCFEKLLRWRAPIFFQNDGGNNTPHPLSKLV